jgi:hypothetical protein
MATLKKYLIHLCYVLDNYIDRGICDTVVIKVVNHLPLTFVGLNLNKDFGFFHVR